MRVAIVTCHESNVHRSSYNMWDVVDQATLLELQEVWHIVPNIHPVILTEPLRTTRVLN